MSQPQSRCEVCGPRDHLLRCGGCKVVFYCTKEHQAADRRDHKRQCNDIINERLNFEAEDAALRSKPSDAFFTQPIFEDGVGHFWGIQETRHYMRARCAFINALIPAGTVESLSLALDHIMDMLRLCRGDNLGMRWQVPALLLRLGKEQQCYDFIKWWAAIEDDGSYDWGNTSLPYLDVKNADVFEPVDIFTKRFSVYLTFDMLLLKVKLLLDLKALQRSPEPSDGFSTSIVQARKDEFRAAGLQPLIEKLESQIPQLYQAVKSSNPHLWPAFMAPEPHLGMRPDFYTPGDLTEAQIALQQSYQAWNETPGAEDVIHRLMAQDPDFPSHR